MGEAGGEGLSHWEGEPLRVWEELWGVPRLEAHARLPSTNDRVRELGLAGAPAFTTVIAEEQTAGRGRSGRRWESPPAMGLWISVLLRPEPGRGTPLTPLVVGVAVARAAEEAADGVEARLEWPNDILVGGRKVAGVLCEGVGTGLVVAGVGVNCRQREEDFPEELRERAGSLEMAAGRRVSRAAVAGALLRELQDLFSPAPALLEGDLAAEVRRRDALRGRRVRTEAGPAGIARGIDPEGALRVEDAGGDVRRIVAGTVRAVGLGTAPARETARDSAREDEESETVREP